MDYKYEVGQYVVLLNGREVSGCDTVGCIRWDSRIDEYAGRIGKISKQLTEEDQRHYRVEFYDDDGNFDDYWYADETWLIPADTELASEELNSFLSEYQK